MKVRFAVLALAAVAFNQSANATKIVKWTDEAGQVHYGSAPPPGAAKQGTQTLNDRGMVIETKAGQTEATKQAEQKKVEAAKLRAEEKLAVEDQRLIDSYASEQDLVRAYQQNVELIEQQVVTTKADLANRQTSLDKLVARAADMERTGKPVNDQLKQMIVSERTQIGRQQEYLNGKIKSKVTAKTQFDLNVQRYRDVLKRDAARQAGTAPK
jgi:Domain of unknown function (DUF4124)